MFLGYLTLSLEMIKKITILFFIFDFLFFPHLAMAHGGVEKSSGNILVTLFQTPLSPLVGEKVTFTFILSNPTKTIILKNKQVRIVVTRTTTGDASKDKIVYAQTVKSDVNGIINFAYTFPFTNYYDIDLEFGKPHDETKTTGFLVQPRENLQNNVQFLEIILVVSIILNFVFLFYWLRNMLKMIRA